MKIAVCRADSRKVGVDYFYERGEIVRLPLAQALKIGLTVLKVEDEDDLPPPIPPSAGSRDATFENRQDRMQRRTKTRA